MKANNVRQKALVFRFLLVFVSNDVPVESRNTALAKLLRARSERCTKTDRSRLSFLGPPTAGDDAQVV
jgi:hypothetical protein